MLAIDLDNTLVDVLVNDDPHYAEEFQHHGRPVVLLDQPYNRRLVGAAPMTGKRCPITFRS